MPMVIGHRRVRAKTSERRLLLRSDQNMWAFSGVIYIPSKQAGPFSIPAFHYVFQSIS